MELTARTVAFIAAQEGIVTEAYKDSMGVWTWSMGLATTGGDDVERYKDNPQSLDICLKAAIDALRSKYLPSVEKAFAGKELTEPQIAAALSFHWNTGAILKAQWIRDFDEGHIDSAKADITQWSGHGLLTTRRMLERDMFFAGHWPASLVVPVYSVAKPSYRPAHAVVTEIMPVLSRIMAG